MVESGDSGYVQRIAVGPHRLTADESAAAGGADEGPNPPELLLSALGVCKGMTVRMYAERKQWALRAVRITLVRSQAERAEQIDVTISFVGELSEEQRRRLLEIAEAFGGWHPAAQSLARNARQYPATVGRAAARQSSWA